MTPLTLDTERITSSPGPYAGTALVTGAGGQDGYFLVQRLLREHWHVVAVARRAAQVDGLAGDTQRPGQLRIAELDLIDAEAITLLIGQVQPDELYHLAGNSSVAASLADPRRSWTTNVDAVAAILEAVRVLSPSTRVYQASTSEMFGYRPGERVVHDEHSRFAPQSPYAAAKAAAHLLCQTYRESFGIRVACGILFNHESRRRPAGFLTRKIVDHVRSLRDRSPSERESIPPLALGNLKVKRDWGYAPDYVDGIVRVIRQVRIRSERFGPEPDTACSYRDYVLGTGYTMAVWELADRAFALAGIELAWCLDGDHPGSWHAVYRDTGARAVVVDPAYIRPHDPLEIQADPARARHDLGWTPHADADRFLNDMLSDQGDS